MDIVALILAVRINGMNVLMAYAFSIQLPEIQQSQNIWPPKCTTGALCGICSVLDRRASHSVLDLVDYCLKCICANFKTHTLQHLSKTNETKEPKQALSWNWCKRTKLPTAEAVVANTPCIFARKRSWCGGQHDCVMFKCFVCMCFWFAVRSLRIQCQHMRNVQFIAHVSIAGRPAISADADRWQQQNQSAQFTPSIFAIYGVSWTKHCCFVRVISRQLRVYCGYYHVVGLMVYRSIVFVLSSKR